MYLGVDVGGTKTLVAVLDEHGVIQESRKFPTPQNYRHFLLELAHIVAFFTTQDFKAAGVAIPAARLDRKHGVGINFGNLAWNRVPVLADVEKILHCPVVLENDAKMAALSEAKLVADKYSRVLYVTISTGIGYGLVVDGSIDPNIGDAGGAGILLEHKGKLVPWESFASGRAIVERYGKRAEAITDDTTWKAIVRDLTQGFIELIAVTEPDIIILGGSVGHYFERYKQFLVAELRKYQNPLLAMPAFKKAERPEEAVVYGCYDLAKATFAHAGGRKTHAKAA